jgi:hypothetical protein
MLLIIYVLLAFIYGLYVTEFDLLLSLLMPIMLPMLVIKQMLN